MVAADVEDGTLVLGVIRRLQVDTLGLDHEDLVEVVVGSWLVASQGHDEVGVDSARLPTLHIVVLPGAVAVPEEEPSLLVQVGRDLVLEPVEVILGGDIEEVLLVRSAVGAVRLLSFRHLDLGGEAVEVKVFRNDQEPHLARRQQPSEDLPRQAVPLHLDLAAQLLEHKGVIGCDLLGGMALEQALEGATRQFAAPPRIRDDVQQVARREEVVGRFAARTRVCVLGPPAELRLQNTLIPAQIRSQVMNLLSPFVQCQGVQRREVNLVPRQPRQDVRLVADQPPAGGVLDHEGRQHEVTRRRPILRPLPGRQRLLRGSRIVFENPPLEALQTFQPESLADLLQHLRAPPAEAEHVALVKQCHSRLGRVGLTQDAAHELG